MSNTNKIDINSDEFAIRLVQFFDEKIGDIYEEYSECKNRNEHNEQSCAGCAEKEYFKNDRMDKTNANYSCQQKTLIYPIRSSLCHAEEISEAMKKCQFVAHFFANRNDYVIASIGYACGTDALAFLKYFCWAYQDGKSNSRITIWGIDKYFNEWKNSAKLMFQFLKENIYPIDKVTVLRRMNFDELQEQANIFMLSYILNELSDEETQSLAEDVICSSQEKILLILNESVNPRNNRKIDIFIEFLRLKGFSKRNHYSVNYSELQDWKNKICSFQRYFSASEKYPGKYKEFQRKYLMKLNKNSQVHILELERK